MLPLEIFPSRGDNRFVALLLAGFALLGTAVAIMAWPDAPMLTIILVVAMAGFGTWAVKLWRRLSDPPVMIRMDDSGITIPHWSAAPIPYSAITSAHWLRGRKSTTILGLALRDPKAHPPHQAFLEPLREADKAIDGVDIKVVISFLDMAEDDILEAFIRRSGIPIKEFYEYENPHAGF